MILQTFRGQLLVVLQTDHGVQTGEFARHWGNEETPSFEPRAAVIEAGTRHDNGWRAWEEQPTLDASTAQPWQFYRLPPHEHVPLYRRGIREAAEHDAYCGLLVSMHGAGLYNDRYGTFRLAEQDFNEQERSLVDEFLQEQAAFQESLAERLERRRRETHVTTDPLVWRNYLLLQVWDRLSLQYAFRLGGDGEISPLPTSDRQSDVLRCASLGEFSLALDPYPFDESPRVFPIAARLVPNRPYRAPEAFLEALAHASVEILECRAQRLEKQ